MNVGVVGLGLIGGSIAKALRYDAGETVLGTDINPDVMYKAKLLNAIDGELTDERMGICDYIIVALYPQTAVDFIKENYKKFMPGAIVMDTCGVKKFVCDEIMPLAEKENFTFIGTHPMAGIEKAGFENSTQGLFKNASIVLTPPKGVSIELLAQLKKFWGQIGFTNLEITTAQNHDRIIAYTSQLAHIASSAYIKSPTALDHSGFSAGSYKDLTRVARLNENMWTELFLENRSYLLAEVKSLKQSLEEYEEALEEEDEQRLLKLLRDGRELKEQADRNDFK